MSEADRMIAQVRAMLGEIQGISEDIQKETREAIKEHQDYLSKAEEGDEERARKARAGELGPDWQKIQRRIDLGETSPGAIALGADDSTAAQNLRRTAAEHTEAIAGYQREQLDSEADSAQDLQVAYGAAQAHLREIREQVARIQARPLPTLD